MSLIGELSVRGTLLLFGETFERVPDAECRFENVHYLTEDDGHTRYVLFWWVSGCPFEAFEGALAADDTVVDFRAITAFPERALYRVETTPLPREGPLVFPTFREHDVTWLEALRDADGLDVRARFPSRDEVEAVVNSDSEIADRIEVTRLSVESSVPGAEDELTAKQSEALTVALDRGYFETPSQVSLAELATEFDVTPQTLSRHIRVGVQKVLTNAIESSTGPSTRHH